MTDKIKALVVDDKRITGDMFGFMLSGDIHDVTVVQSADEALGHIKKNDYDVVFLDIIMPGKDGIETLEEIREIKPRLPVIMMSGYTVEDKRSRIHDLGVSACLEKPVEMNTVREVVKAALGKDI